MKRIAHFLCGFLFFLVTVGFADAGLITIGTVNYDSNGNGTSEAYNLIWDDNDDLVWLDYSNDIDTWANQVAWASGLNTSGVLTYNLNPGFTLDWGASQWRLPVTVDGGWHRGYEGDPDGDGNYTYTWGYNLANSEMGDLFYTELGNKGYQNTDGSFNASPAAPDYFLQKTGDFNNLIASWYWSGTEWATDTNNAWFFCMDTGQQDVNDKRDYGYGLAVRSGQVSIAPIPEPGTILLFGIGILGLAGCNRRRKWN